MIIRISGHQGSGKTTVARKLAEAFGWQFSYTGGIFREMAAEAGQHLEEFYRKMKEDPELEKSIDGRQAKLMASRDNLVVDGRLAAFFPSPFLTFNIFLRVDRLEGSRRQQKRAENQGRSVEEIAAATDQRMAEERERYRQLYGIENHMDETKFNCVMDTTNLSEGQVFNHCYCEAAFYQFGKMFEKYIKNPA